MSLINFLNSKLKPSVECDAVCEDGYEASNLIADNADQLARGFMAFSVTKPPAEIIFEFPKAVEVKVIKLWNTIRSLRSTSFEVHGKHDGIWERVAFVRDIAKGVDSVTFCYQSDYSSRSNNGSSGNADQQSEKVFFFKTAHKILANAKSIKIIIRATHKCPPVLRQVQVWGLPARSLEKADRELVKTIWSEVTNPYGLQTQEERNGQRSMSRCVPELNENSELNIPEEFLDAITWELMTFPTVLPSGKIVDQSTIDKHSEVEAKWGRMPSDPFTGLEFTPHRKAILNPALKGRIEQFLMENADHFKTVPRCLGGSRVRRSKNRHVSQFASLCHNQSSTASALVGSYSSLSALSRKSGTIKKFATTVTSSETSLPAKRPRLSGDYLNYPSEVTLRRKCTTTTQTSSTVTAPNMVLSLSPSSNGSSIVSEAIQQAMQKMTRYTCLPVVTTPATCIRCKSEEFTYEIQTCKHLVCRDCLVQMTPEHMCICKTSFCNADVERYHKL